MGFLLIFANHRVEYYGARCVFVWDALLVLLFFCAMECCSSFFIFAFSSSCIFVYDILISFFVESQILIRNKLLYEKLYRRISLKIHYLKMKFLYSNPG